MQIPGPAPLVTHWPSVEHGTQVLDATSQIGFAGAPVQSALVALRHSTHDPFGPQNGREPSRAAHAAPSPARELSHVRHDRPSQIGFSAGHWLFVAHSAATSEASPSGGPPSVLAQVKVAAPWSTQDCPEGQSASLSQWPALSLLSLQLATISSSAATASDERARIRSSPRTPGTTARPGR
jgi:hypothetical protein